MHRLRRVAAHLVVLALSLTLTACLPSLQNLAIPTIAAPPAASPAAPFSAASPLPSGTALPTTTPTASFTPISTFTPGGTSITPSPTPSTTGTLPTAAGPTATLTQAASTAGSPVSVNMDTLPRDTVYKPVVIRNKSHAQMDISLHCTTHQGLQTVIEYEHVRTLSDEIPECDYVYVVWVGARQIVGSFTLYRIPDIAITVYAQRVDVH